MKILTRLVVPAVWLGQVAGAAEVVPANTIDPQIRQIVGEISPVNIEATIRKLVSFKSRHTLSSTTHPTEGIGAARNWIKAELERSSRESGGRLVVEFDAFRQEPMPPRLPNGADIVNVIATLPGVQPWAKDRVYVVSGHYDSLAIGETDYDAPAPGANDDASGTAAVMELARVMSRHTFDATIVFMAVAAEEQGLNGSRHWAKEAKRKGVKVAAMFTNDIVGNTLAEDGSRDSSYVRLFAEGVLPRKEMSPEVLEQLGTGGENDFSNRQLARLVQEVAARYVPQLKVKMVYRRDRFHRGGDHAPFLDEGFPALRLTEPVEAYTRQHQRVREENGQRFGDTIEFIDFAYTANVARVNAAALAELASAPASPSGVQVEVIQLEHDTTLRWEPSPEPDLAGYRIVWRETTAPSWEHAVDVPKTATRHTVKGVSKDNFIFGVQAVDQGGHVSPAVYPRTRLRL